MAKNLHITLLGSPGVTGNGRSVTGFVSSKAQALVYYLAATGQTHTRDALAGLLWSEVADEKAKKNLRDVLSNLRQLLPDCLDISRQTVCLLKTAEITIDTTQFTTLTSRIPANLTATTAHSLQEAVNLYKGEFLAGFYLAEAPLFEEWVLGERERLRQLALQALHTLAGYHSQQKEFSQGITYVTRLLAMDPWREESHRQLMLLLALSGQRSAALAQYERCCRTLADELGVEPADETTALYEQVKADKATENPLVTLLPLHPLPHSSPHNLPTQLTPLIGREAEVTQILTRLQDPGCRMLTLVGPGGVGKTSLAMEAAQAALSSFVQGVYVVPLAAVETADWQSNTLYPVIAQMATSLRLVFSGQETPQIQLFNYLRQKQLLLVLDNYEQLVSTAHFLVQLLQEAPSVKLLITSRARLNVQGEQVLILEGLPYPAPGTAEWQSYSAIQLFGQRAQAVQPGFTLQANDATALIRICELVDGLPLGIELAASWVRLLPCNDIAHEIEQNLSFLESSRRDTPQRHQSLRAVFDHSWHLLTEAERRALRQLSVFRGGFGRDAATRVAGASLSVLAALVDNSLLRRTTPDRYELQDVLRQYAFEKLTMAPDAIETAVRDRHSQHYLSFLHQSQADLQGSRQTEVLAEIFKEIENIWAAWNWAVQKGHIVALNGAADTLGLFYYMRSWSQEGETTFAQAVRQLVELETGDPTAYVARAKLLSWQGWFTSLLTHQSAAHSLLQQSIEILRLHGTATDLIFPLSWLAVVTSYHGNYIRTQQLCQEVLNISRANGNRYGIAISKNILSQVAYIQGEYPEARRYCQESLAIEREIGNRWSMTFSLTNLGRVAYALGDYREAQARYRESLVIREALGDARGTAVCLNDLGDTADALGDYATAHQQYQKSLEISQEIGNPWGISASLTRLGYLVLAQGDNATAHEQFQQAIRVAHSSQAWPRVLDALIGIASLIVTNDPAKAFALCAFVQHHPAVSKDSQNRAVLLLNRIKTADFYPFPPETTLSDVVEAVSGSIT